MGAAKRLKAILKDKRISQKNMAEMMGKPLPTIYNTFHKDEMKFSTVEMYAEFLGCEILFRDKETGKIY